MFLHSFCGILTLQIGVTVLAAIFINLAVLAVLSNFLHIHVVKDNTYSGIPLNYITLSILILLLLIAGVVMFLAAYNEDKKTCLSSVILVVIILIFFVITSILSFLNNPSLTKHICVYHDHCPESLYLSSLNYRISYGEEENSETTDATEENEAGTMTTGETNTDSTTVESTTGDESGFQRRHKFKRRKQHVRVTESTTVESTTGVESGFQRRHKFKRRKQHSRVTESNSNNVIKPGSETSTEPTKIKSFQFSLDSPALQDGLFLDNTGNEGVLGIVKRSISSVVNYVKEEHSIKRKKMEPKEIFYIENIEGEDLTTTEEPSNEEENKDNKGGAKAQYVFGFDLFMAVVLFLIIIGFFIFTIIVLLSYRKKIKLDIQLLRSYAAVMRSADNNDNNDNN